MIVQGINDNHLLSFKITDEIIKDKKIVGTFIKNSAELSATNINHVYNVLNNTYVTIQGLGKWYVNEISDDEANVQIKMKLFDLSQKFDKEYEDTFNFPATMKQWATWIGLKVGVPLKGDFPNSDVTLSERPYIGSNPTYRNAVMLIATYAGSFGRTNFDNTYSICWFDSTLESIEDFISFEHGDEKSEVNTLVLSTGDTNDNVEYPEEPLENPVELRIEDDFNYVNRFDLLVAIYNQVNGFNYVPIKKLEVPYGLLCLRAGGRISCQDLERNVIESFVSYHCLQWQGGTFDDPNSWKSTLKMSELNETNTNHKFAQSIPNELMEVKRETNKNTGEIKDIISKTENNEQQITSLRLATNSIQANVTSSTNNLSNQISALASSTSLQINAINSQIENGVEKLTNSLVTIDVNGINTSKEDESFNTQITNKTFEVKDGSRELAFIGYDSSINKTVARIPELEAKKITAGNHRCESITRNGKKRTAWYYVGGDN